MQKNPFNGANIGFDNTGSGLSSTNIQDAINEVNNKSAVNTISCTNNTTYILNADTHISVFEIGKMLIFQGWCQVSTEIPTFETAYTLSGVSIGFYQYVYLLKTTGETYKMNVNNNILQVVDRAVPAGYYSIFGIVVE